MTMMLIIMIIKKVLSWVYSIVVPTTDIVDYNNELKLPHTFSRRLERLTLISAVIPCGALVICVAWSMYYHFEEANDTHCKVRGQEIDVKNWFPSISACTGYLKPEITIWQWCISIQTITRISLVPGHSLNLTHMLKESRSVCYLSYVSVMFGIHLVELTALLRLSLITSNVDSDVHKLSFIAFVVCSVLYMLMCMYYTYTLSEDKLDDRRFNIKLRSSLRYKRMLSLANWLCLMAVWYFFYRHETYCEDGVYSLFAISEYLFVFTNIGFHSTAILDYQAAHFQVNNVVSFRD